MDTLRRYGLLAVLLLMTAGCAGGSGGNGGSSSEDSGVPSKTTQANTTTGGTSTVPETTRESTAEGTSQSADLRIERLASGAQGPERRQILIASSARDLAAATGLEVPDAGEGTYVAVVWGEKPTGGYTVDFGSASVEGVRVIVSVELKQPSPDAMVAQALTYPYAVAILRGVDPGEKEFIFMTQNGRQIGWPVRSV